MPSSLHAVALHPVCEGLVACEPDEGRCSRLVALGLGFSHPERASGTAISIVPYPRWVSLFFLRGANLHDPHGLLVGKGSQVRHIVLDREDLLDDPRVLALIDQELNRSGRASNPLAERRVMIMVCTP